MPRRNNNTIALSKQRIDADIAKLLLRFANDLATPSYLPGTDIKEMQKYVGSKPGSDAPPRRHAPFSHTELPRSVPDGDDGVVVTPSWFRYVNMDGHSEGQTIPEGYHWDIEYYRREDDSLVTRPVLVELQSGPLEDEGDEGFAEEGSADDDSVDEGFLKWITLDGGQMARHAMSGRRKSERAVDPSSFMVRLHSASLQHQH
jgi:hypothetical protein